MESKNPKVEENKKEAQETIKATRRKKERYKKEASQIIKAILKEYRDEN